MDISRDPDTYIVTLISFRDRPSENIATMALRKTAKMKEKEYPHAASMILNNTYVDDIVNTVKDRDEANNLVRQTNHILNHDGFAVKHWTASGCDESPNEKSD